MWCVSQSIFFFIYFDVQTKVKNLNKGHRNSKKKKFSHKSNSYQFFFNIHIFNFNKKKYCNELLYTTKHDLSMYVLIITLFIMMYIIYDMKFYNLFVFFIIFMYFNINNKSSQHTRPKAHQAYTHGLVQKQIMIWKKIYFTW